MFCKYQFVKGLFSHKSFIKTLVPSFSQPQKAFQAPKSLNFPSFNCFFSSVQGLHHAGTYQEDFYLLQQFSREQLTYGQEVMNRYVACKDLRLLNSDDIQWVSSILSHLMVAHRDQGDREKAYRYMTELEDLQNRLGIKDTYDVANCHFMLGCEYLDRQDFTKANEYSESTDRICKLLGNDEPGKSLKIQNWNLQAAVYWRMNQEERALEMYYAILANTHEVVEPALPGLLVSVYQDMKDIYIGRNDIGKTIEYAKKYIDALIQYYGEDSNEVFNVYCHFSNLLIDQNNMSEALVYSKKSLQVGIQVYSKKSINVAWVHSTIGNIYKLMNEYTKALDQYDKAIKISEKLPEDYSEFQSEVYSLAAGAHQSLGNHKESNIFFDKANDLKIKANQDNDVGVAESHIKQARELREQGTWRDSQACLRKALDIYENLEPLDYSKIADLYGLMGQLSYGEEEWERALEFFKESEKHLDKFHAKPSRVQYTYIYMITAYRGLENYDESLKYCQKIIQSAEVTGETRYLGTAYYDSGRVYEVKGMFKAALEAYQTAEKYEGQQFGKDHAETKACMEKVLEMQKKVKEMEKDSVATASKISRVLKSFKNTK